MDTDQVVEKLDIVESMFGSGMNENLIEENIETFM